VIVDEKEVKMAVTEEETVMGVFFFLVMQLKKFTEQAIYSLGAEVWC
jgi:hypothetical protein